MDTTKGKQPGVTLRDGTAHIQVWAPLAEAVSLHAYQPDVEVELAKDEHGYWCGKSDQLHDGQKYHFRVDGRMLPDPASRSQPEGVHGPSAVLDISYDWTDYDFRPPHPRDLIIYELHVGTFSQQGNFDGVIERLPYLKALGINAIEIMPVSQFPGERNWGYDGVFSFAVQHSYGGAGALQRLVDACHKHGIAVVLDVVYNHFGPEGNYLPAFGPYFTDKYQTPWGQAVNYDDAWNVGIRDFVVENVRMWFRDFHIDALRLDAVHAIRDFSPSHILQDIRRATDHLIKQKDRPYYLFVECDLNDRRFLEPLEKNGFAMDAQWLDEFHHALRVSIGEQRIGYYREFEPVSHLAKAYHTAYVFDGTFSSHRKKFFGSSAEGLAGERFIVFSQNHDQVGNRMLGERSSMLYTADVQRLAAMAVLVSPFIPLLFMGEEWAAKTPFLYFVSHSDNKLIKAVQEGRRAEFADFHHEGDVPDPQSESTFERSILNWNEIAEEPHKRILAYYQALIQLRTSNPVLKNYNRRDLRIDYEAQKQSIVLTMTHEASVLLCVLNFSTSNQTFPLPHGKWTKIWDSADARWGGRSVSPHQCQGELPVTALSGAIYQHD